jgi:hypothetical protein
MAEAWRFDEGRLAGLAVGTVFIFVPFGDELRVTTPAGAVLLRLEGHEIAREVAPGGLTMRLTSSRYEADATLSLVDVPAPAVLPPSPGMVRLRRLAGVTLLALTAFMLGVGLLALSAPNPEGGEPWGQFLGFVMIVFAGVPTLLAALAVVLGRSWGAILGGVVSLLLGLAVAGVFISGISIIATSQNQPEASSPLSWAPMMLALGVITAAYWFAAVASFKARRAVTISPPASART